MVSRTAHRNNFDFVRLFAAFIVLVSHQFAFAGLDEPLVFEGTLGGLGVCIFFSISGYLVASSWARSADPIVFARKRLTRIWPGIAALTIFSAFVLGPLVTTKPLAEYLSSPVTADYMLQLALQMKPALPGVFEQSPLKAINGSLWSIPIELEWYVILGCLGIAGIAKRTWAMVLATLLLLAYVLQQTYTGKPGAVNVLAVFGVCFMIGATLSTVRAWMLRSQRAILITVSALAVAFSLIGLAPIAVYVFVPVTAILVGEGSSRWVRNAGRYGDFSYGFYLYAFPVQQTILWLADYRMSLPLALALSAIVTFAFAVASWKLVEGPAMKVGVMKRRTATA